MNTMSQTLSASTLLTWRWRRWSAPSWPAFGTAFGGNRIGRVSATA
jgi:hypothetical protein